MHRGGVLLGKRRALLLCLSTLAAICFLVWRLWPPPNAEEVARAGLACIEQQDSGCLYDLAEKRELESHGLDRAAFERLLREYVFRGPWRQEGQPVVRRGPEQGAAMGQLYLDQGGTPVSMGVHAIDTGARIELDFLVTSLILSRMPAKTDTMSGPKRMLTWIARDREKLERLGVRGIARHEGFFTWDQLVDRYSEAYAQ